MVAELIEHLVVDETTTQPHCSCDEGPKFDSYRDGELVATLGLAHEKFLHWYDGWPGDALLTEESMAFFSDWLAERGQLDSSQELLCERGSVATAGAVKLPPKERRMPAQSVT